MTRSRKIPACAGEPVRGEVRMLLKEANLHWEIGEKDRPVIHLSRTERNPHVRVAVA